VPRCQRQHPITVARLNRQHHLITVARPNRYQPPTISVHRYQRQYPITVVRPNRYHPLRSDVRLNWSLILVAGTVGNGSPGRSILGSC
jgi:hypothetical protein